MRILIAGAAGFVGSHLVDRLLVEGHHVLGVDNCVTGRAINLSHLRAESRFNFIQHDVIQPLQVDGPLDWVMHFASPASPPKYLKYPVETLRVNSEGTYHLLEMTRQKGAKFFLASTSESYGDPTVHPQPEGYWGNVNPVGPRSVYDEGKRFAEAMTMAYHRHNGISTRIIRIFNTYGPRMDPNDGRVVSNFLNQALRGEPLTVYGDGRQTRSFQFIDDLVEGIVRYMSVEHPGPVNLGNPEEYTMIQLAELVKELIGGHVTIVFKSLPQDDPKQRRPDTSLAKELLGWAPSVPVRQGLQQTAAYFREFS